MLKTKKLIELLLFLFVFIIYSFTVSHTINFWDSSEFIASNFTLQASHPPGAPFYTLFCSLILSFFSASSAAYITNLISAFFGALTVLLLHKITHMIVVEILPKRLKQYTKELPVFCGLLSALSLAFSTSFWTAATEAEVYTMSFALFCALIYVALLWSYESATQKKNRLLLIFALLLGLSLSVHPILATIVIPFSVLVAHTTFKTGLKTLAIALVMGVVAFIIIYALLFKGLINLSAATDIYAVNSLGFGVNIGAILVIFTAVLILLLSVFFSRRSQRHTLNTLSKGVLLFILGLSPYVLPVLRSDVNTLVAEKVDTANRLKTYASANRFGVDNIPLLYGPTYNAQLDETRPFVNGKSHFTYDPESESYLEIDDGKFSKVNYSCNFKTVFPRMYDAKNEFNYKAWTTIKGEAINHKVNGEFKTFNIPTFKENLGFFINYQVVWLNLRYLFWNFIGRQNDYHGVGYSKNGNWLSGIGFIDTFRLGDESLAPSYYQNNKGKDVYYFLPFLLGLIGVLALRHNKKLLITSVLLFLTFGLGITLYINPLPSSILVRERDYIFIGSFIIFALWIGLSLVFIIDKIQVFNPQKSLIWMVFILISLASPLQLFAKGWDNHQSTQDSFAYEFGKAYLDSCPEQAILITNGDNMTFPLWYLQDVEGYRTDVRVINFDQLNIDTHINNLTVKKHSSQPVSIDLNKSLYIDGMEKLIPLQQETEKPIPLELLTQFLNSSETLTNWNGKMRHYIPGTSFQISIDTTKLGLDYKSLSYDLKPVAELRWQFNKAFYGLNDIVLMNLIKNNIFSRPICFANNSKSRHQIGLGNYLVQEGLVSRLMPFNRKSSTSNPKIVNTAKSYSVLNNDKRFKGLRNDNSYIRDENRTYAREILRQNYYFVAQALLEENKIEAAKTVLDKSLELFPDETVPFKEYAFAQGKLYLRLGETKLGYSICLKSMANIKKELEWMLSCNPANPIINVRHATKLYNMYTQMTEQLKQFHSEEFLSNSETIKELNSKLQVWQSNNWPYSKS